MSSGDVSTRTSNTSCPLRVRSSASLAVNTICPQAAPGDAGRARVSKFFSACGSSLACSNWSSDCGSMCIIASSCVICPQSSISQAMRIAACAVRLPARVCNRNRRFFSTVNSISCMSR